MPLALSRKLLLLLRRHVIGSAGHCACAAGRQWRFRKARGHRHGRHTGNWHACGTTVHIFEHTARIPANCFGPVASVAAQSTGPVASAYAGGLLCEVWIEGQCGPRGSVTSQLDECSACSPSGRCHARLRDPAQGTSLMLSVSKRVLLAESQKHSTGKALQAIARSCNEQQEPGGAATRPGMQRGLSGHAEHRVMASA